MLANITLGYYTQRVRLCIVRELRCEYTYFVLVKKERKRIEIMHLSAFILFLNRSQNAILKCDMTLNEMDFYLCMYGI